MKLSGKGLANVFYHQSLDLDIDSYDFKPEDFTGAVVLTVEEARHLLSIVRDCKHAHCITQEESDVFNEFVKRTKQAEKKE